MNTTAEALHAEAQAHYEEQAASFERCDTDGFVSQWASGIMGDLARVKARLVEQGGESEFHALFDLDGNVISTHEGYGQYGRYYVLTDEAEARFGRRFISPSGAQKIETRRKNNRAKGVTEGTIRARAYAETFGRGTGLSGALSVSIVVRPVVEDLLAGKFTIVTTEA